MPKSPFWRIYPADKLNIFPQELIDTSIITICFEFSIRIVRQETIGALDAWKSVR